MIAVQLTSSELMLAGVIGSARHTASLQRGREDQHGYAGQDPWQIHIEGAAGEIAFCKAFGIYWPASVNTFKRADVPPDIQIKTRSKASYDLIVRRNDDPDYRYVLVTGTAPAYQLRGWIWGREARQDEFLAEHGGREAAWFIPPDRLMTLEGFSI
jgi:hypothetical protein